MGNAVVLKPLTLHPDVPDRAAAEWSLRNRDPAPGVQHVIAGDRTLGHAGSVAPGVGHGRDHAVGARAGMLVAEETSRWSSASPRARWKAPVVSDDADPVKAAGVAGGGLATTTLVRTARRRPWCWHRPASG